MNNRELVCFLKIVENKYSFENDCCEIEQTLDAMRMYLMYPIYKDWNLASHDYRTGSWKLNAPNGTETLTADVLTSIRQAVAGALEKSIPQEFKGVHIVKAIVDNPFYNICNGVGKRTKLNVEQNKEAIKAFASVVYWIGNMLPVPNSYSPGPSGKQDTWYFKMKYILNILYGIEDTRHAWDIWRKSWKNKPKEFINGNYLQDMVEEKDGEKDRKFYVKDYASKGESWFIENTKLIIQRSYRIVYQFSEDWNASAKDEENVKSIMQYVFKQAGFNETEAKNLATIF